MLTRRQAAFGFCATALLIGTGCAVQSNDESISKGEASLTVDNVEQLRAVAGTHGLTVAVLGFATPGDGGGGLFTFKASAVITDNVGYAIKSANGVWERQMSSKDVSVKWFGAVGDGSHNDADAVAMATRVALALKGRVFVPNGLYKVDGVGKQVSLAKVSLTTDSQAKLADLVTETGLTINYYPSLAN